MTKKVIEKEIKEEAFAIVNRFIPQAILFCDLNDEKSIQRWGVFRKDEKSKAKELAKDWNAKLVPITITYKIKQRK
jgi:hypothetical protein